MFRKLQKDFFCPEHCKSASLSTRGLSIPASTPCLWDFMYHTVYQTSSRHAKPTATRFSPFTDTNTSTHWTTSKRFQCCHNNDLYNVLADDFALSLVRKEISGWFLVARLVGGFLVGWLVDWLISGWFLIGVCLFFASFWLVYDWFLVCWLVSF